jgi:hypothetical protein
VCKLRGARWSACRLGGQGAAARRWRACVATMDEGPALVPQLQLAAEAGGRVLPAAIGAAHAAARQHEGLAHQGDACEQKQKQHLGQRGQRLEQLGRLLSHQDAGAARRGRHHILHPLGVGIRSYIAWLKASRFQLIPICTSFAPARLRRCCVHASLPEQLPPGCRVPGCALAEQAQPDGLGDGRGPGARGHRGAPQRRYNAAGRRSRSFPQARALSSSSDGPGEGA